MSLVTKPKIQWVDCDGGCRVGGAGGVTAESMAALLGPLSQRSALALSKALLHDVQMERQLFGDGEGGGETTYILPPHRTIFL